MDICITTVEILILMLLWKKNDIYFTVLRMGVLASLGVILGTNRGISKIEI